MSSLPPNSQQSFLPTTLILPSTRDEQEFNYILSDFLRKMLAAINDKDIGQYVLQEVQNGQQYFEPNSTNTFRGIYRKVIEFGALPNTATKEINHEITVTDTLRFTRIYGTANDSDTSYLPLPFASSVAGDGISLEITPTVIRITTAIDYSAYTETFIILEYFKA